MTDREPLPEDEVWEVFRDVVWAYYLAEVRQNVDEKFGDLEENVLDGERPTHAEIGVARDAIEQAEVLLERYEELAPDVPDDGGRRG